MTTDRAKGITISWTTASAVILAVIAIGFAGGWLTTISHAPAAAPEPVAAVNGQPNGVEAAAARPAQDYDGIVAALVDGQLQVRPLGADEKTAAMTLLIGDTTVIKALRPKTAEEIRQEAGGAGKNAGRDSSQGVPPPPLPVVANPYKETDMVLSEFKVGDLVRFTTSDEPFTGTAIKVTAVTWLAGSSSVVGPETPPVGGAAPANSGNIPPPTL